MTQEQLASAMTEAGRPIIKSGINKLEQVGGRRVDVDDLMALSVALGVSPLRLLLPAEPPSKSALVTEAKRARVRDVWAWARGEHPLPGRASDPDQFRRENQPDQQPMGVREALQNGDQLRALAESLAALEARGFSRASILATVQLVAIEATTDEGSH